MASVDCAPVATGVAGQKNAACTGTDRAGNTRTRLIPYTVAAPLGEVLFWFDGSQSPTMNRINVDGTARSSFAVNQARSIAANVTNLFYVVKDPTTSDGPLVRTDLDGANGVVGQGDMSGAQPRLYIRNPVNLLKIYPDGVRGADTGFTPLCCSRQTTRVFPGWKPHRAR
jgi:hypothetical protein